MQVLTEWAQQRGLDPGTWRLLVHKGDEVEPPIGIFSTKTVTDVLPPPWQCETAADASQVNAMVAFRGLELPGAIAPLRLADCDPAKRARADTVIQAFDTHLELILPFALGEPLDIARAALVAPSWAAGIRAWFGVDHWLKVWGIETYFPTPGQAAATLPILKAIERPSPELYAAVSKFCTVNNGPEFYDGFNLRIAKLAGLPYTFLWRYALLSSGSSLMHTNQPNPCTHRDALLPPAAATGPTSCSLWAPCLRPAAAFATKKCTSTRRASGTGRPV